MKHLLLASASLVAFAGAAAAEITYSGSAKLGYNDTAKVNGNGEFGFYWAGDLILDAAQELDNGLTFGGSVDIKLARDNDADYSLKAEDFVMSLTAGELGGLTFGNTEYAPVSYWKATALNLHADTFSEQDDEYVLKGDITYGNIKAGLSTPVSEDTIGQLGLGVNATFGTFDVAFAYQEALSADYVPQSGASASDLNKAQVTAISAGTTLAGATTRVAFATKENQDSVGVSATYPLGAVTLTGGVAFESGAIEGTSFLLRAAYKADAFNVRGTIDSRARGADGVDNDLRWDIQGGYNLGNGVEVFAGALGRDSWTRNGGSEAFYVGAEYDLGNGGKLVASYADADNTSVSYLEDDEVGARAYQDGTTLEVSFKF